MTKRKIAIAIAAAALAGTCAIGGTLAWLTSTTSNVRNAFTMGNVFIELDEADVDEPGKRWSASSAGDYQSYNLTPGTTTLKDPTVTVKADSESCYVFVAVKDTLTINAGFSLENSELSGEGADWISLGTDGMPEGYTLYRYKDVVTPVDKNADDIVDDVELVLFTGVTVANTVSSLPAGDPTIDIKAFAIQEEGLGVDDDAAIAEATKQAKIAFQGLN